MNKQQTEIAEHMSQQSPHSQQNALIAQAEQRHENVDYWSQRMKPKNEKNKTKNTNATTDIIQGHLTIFRCSVTGWWQKGLVEKKKKASQTKCKEKGKKSDKPA